MRIELGAAVRVLEATVGTASDLVVDPATRRLTHIVVTTPDRQARLVPRPLVESVPPHSREMMLACTAKEFAELPAIREYAYLHPDEFPRPDADSDVGIEEMIATRFDEETEVGDYAGVDTAVGLRFDRIPKGEAEISRSSFVCSATGNRLGHVDGVLMTDDRVTHLVVRHGRLWRKRDIAVPIESVERIETDSATVSLSAEQIAGLPRVSARRASLLWW